MQTYTLKQIEQDVCETFGWSKPNIFVMLTVQAIDRIQACYAMNPTGKQQVETPAQRAEAAAQLKIELALLKQLKEAMNICAFARKMSMIAQNQRQTQNGSTISKMPTLPGMQSERGGTPQKNLPAAPSLSALIKKHILPSGGDKSSSPAPNQPVVPEPKKPA